jgi:hypothetical protein
VRGRPTLRLAVALLVVVAGCAGGGGDDGPVVARAEAAAVERSALDATGYERVARSSETTNTTVTVTLRGDVEVQSTFDVRATVRRVVYERPVAGGVATVGVVSVPGVRPSEALAEPRDPFAGRGVAALATNATTVAVTDARPTGNATVRLFGDETTLRRYAATGRRDGTARDVTVAVARARHDGDFVRVVAVVPAGATERDRVARLVAAVRHGEEGEGRQSSLGSPPSAATRPDDRTFRTLLTPM